MSGGVIRGENTLANTCQWLLTLSVPHVTDPPSLLPRPGTNDAGLMWEKDGVCFYKESRRKRTGKGRLRCDAAQHGTQRGVQAAGEGARTSHNMASNGRQSPSFQMKSAASFSPIQLAVITSSNRSRRRHGNLRCTREPEEIPERSLLPVAGGKGAKVSLEPAETETSDRICMYDQTAKLMS